MKKKSKSLNRVFLLIISLFFLALTSTFSLSENPIVLVSTEKGEITIELYEKNAPITVSNFLKYVDNQLYDNGTFFRVVNSDNDPEKNIKIAVIQAGIQADRQKESFPPIKHETTEESGILHKDGVISMARTDPGTATSSFFICVGDQPELDYGGKRNPDGQGFAAFGKVINGMNVVYDIHTQPTDGQTLNPSIKIHFIKRIKNN